MKNNQKKRSPLKDKPLRHAGQSLNEQIEDKRTDVLVYLLYILTIAVLILGDWIRYLFPQEEPGNPILGTIIVLGITIYLIYKSFKTVKEIKLLIMGRDGEKIVAEELQGIIKDGAAIIHDIVGDNFNIDHVIISKHGIFLVETKTYSKPIKKETIITFDENHVYVDGHKIDREPIKQVKSLSKWLQDLLLQTTGQKFPIHPVILFPGWYTDRIKKGQDIWILNPKALPTFISNEPVSIKDTDVHLITYHLSRYVRTHKAN